MKASAISFTCVLVLLVFIVLVHGSSARARSMHVLSRSLAKAGFTVAALDMRGHGDSGTRGQAAYIDQLDDAVNEQLTSSYSYSYTLTQAFGPHDDYQGDIRGSHQPMQLLGGSKDEWFDASRYASTFADADRQLPVTLASGVNHMGLTLDERAMPAIIEAARK